MIIVYGSGIEHYEIIGVAVDEAGAQKLLERRIAHQTDERTTKWYLNYAESICFCSCEPGEYLLEEARYLGNNERVVATREYKDVGKFHPWVLKDS